MKSTKIILAFVAMVGGLFAQRPAVWAPSEDVPDSPVTSPAGINSPQVAYGSGPNQIKGTDAFTYTEGTGVLRINSTSTAALRGMTAYQYSASTDSAKYNGLKARGTSSSPSVITTGDFLTRWSGWGYDGSNFIESASIGFGSTGTIAATRVPSFITFMTGTNAAPTVMTESFRVESDQSIRRPNTNTLGDQWYNTADQVTNYERLEILWTGNLATVRTAIGGTGTARQLLVGTANNSIRFRTGGDPSGTIQLLSQSTGVAGNIAYNFSGYTSTATSGTNVGLSLTPTYNQASGTAANTDFLVNRTETAVGSGQQNFEAFQVGGTTRWRVSNLGGAYIENVGQTLNVKQGTNSKAGTFTLTAGAATVSNTAITANSVIVMTLKTVGGTVGTQAPMINTITPSTGFTVIAAGTNTSTYNYVVLEATP